MGEVLSVRLDGDLKQRLSDLSKRTGRKEAFYVRAALNEYLQDLEDEYLALEALRRYKTGQVSYTSDEVKQILELDN